MSVITRSTHHWALWPGIKTTFGRDYKEPERQYSRIFDVRDSDQAYEEIPEVTGFGLVPQKPEGVSRVYDTENPGPLVRFTHVAYSLGFIVTYEEKQDGKYEVVGSRRASALARSFRQTKETVSANVLNRAFNSSYTGADGKELVATDHPTLGGTGSNELAVAADLSETALEDLYTQIRGFKDSRGLLIAQRARALVIPPALQFEAYRILNSVNTPGSANNDVNAIRAMGAFPDGVIVNDYLTDTDAWFILTDAQNGLIMFDREALGELEQDNDFDTKNAKAAYYERYSVGWADWRSIAGSAGA